MDEAPQKLKAFRRIGLSTGIATVVLYSSIWMLIWSQLQLEPRDAPE